MKTYEFRLPIGDWSDDGHGQCEKYIIESNKPMKRVMKAYLDMDDAWNLSKQCSKYEDRTISDQFFIDSSLKREDYMDEDEDYGPDDLAKLIIDTIMQWDPTIKLKIIKDQLPEFNNWEAPEGKYLELPGYGLFS